jgi:FKBP-type peptidyl-prolyl cis-trans isomerase
MAKTHQRVFALIAAVLFLATSVATGAVVIWQINKDSDQSKALQEAQSAASDLKTTDKQQETNMLQGTKLTDFTPVASTAELKIIDLKEGTGAVVPEGATITAHYTGALAADGTIFQSSLDSGQPVQFSLSGVIEGWTKGVPGMKVGGKRRLIIPYAQAYGEAGRPDGGIPAKADLVFDIELVSMP